MEDAAGAAHSASLSIPSSQASTSSMSFRREHDDNDEAERGMKQIYCFQEHIPKEDRQVSFPDAALDHIFSLISSNADRNSVSLVCKRWYSVEQHSRRHVFITKCNDISPSIVIQRFTNVRSLTITNDCSQPKGCHSCALPWVSMMVTDYPMMEEITMKHMLVTDDGLVLIRESLKNLRDLALYACSGFSTIGLSCVAANCRNLRKLHISDFQLEPDDFELSEFETGPDDFDLVEIAAQCKELQELLVEFYESDLTEEEIVSIVMGCPKLHSIEYRCSSMTNAALLTIADQLPNLSRLCIGLNEPSTDHLTDGPFDTGFASVLERCKNLMHLAIRGLVITERLLESIGTHGKKVETLDLFLIGDLDSGLHHIVSGCSSLKCLSVEACDFGDQALLKIDRVVETLESLKMWSCPVKYKACKLLKERYPKLNFEVNGQVMPLLDLEDESLVETLHIYRIAE